MSCDDGTQLAALAKEASFSSCRTMKRGIPMCKTLLATSALVIAVVASGPVNAQAVIEGLPDHLVRRIEADQVNTSLQRLVAQGAIQQGVVSGAKRWGSAEPVRVCFFGGSLALRTRIMNIANQWTAGSPLRFDWGSASNPRICNNEFAHIRVGYSPTGYWSLVGQDSVVYAGQLEQSLNLGRFDFNPPADPEFTATVLHEFGHALGFQHEHQHPQSVCEQEFNWPQIYSYLAGPPNYWSPEKVNHNMRQRTYIHSDVTTTFDPNSIMLYSFPAQFYLRGTNSACYTRGNNTLSSGDKQTFAQVYTTRDQQLARIEDAAQGLSLSARALVNDRVSLLRLENTLKAAVVSRTELDQATPTFGAAIGEALEASMTPD